MPIRINLLAEAQAAAELRRKDPVKRGIWIGSFLVLAMLLWIAKYQLDVTFEKSAYNKVESEWKSKMTQYSAVTNNQARTAEIEQKLRALDNLSTNRFLWAPVLNALQQTVVDDVQVVRLDGVQSYTAEEGREVTVGASHHRIPGAMTEKVSLTIEAKDMRPGDEDYTKYKERLCAFDFFAKRLGRRDGFVIEGTLRAADGEPGGSEQTICHLHFGDAFSGGTAAVNKLSKTQRDQLLAIAMGTVVLMGVLWYFGVTAMQAELVATRRKSADMRQKLHDAEALMRRGDEISGTLQTRSDLLAKREAGLAPDRDSYAWLIDTMNNFIQSRKGVNIDTYSQPEISDKGLIPHFPYRWATFHLRGTGYYQDLGKFFADLENSFPYFRVRKPESVGQLRAGHGCRKIECGLRPCRASGRHQPGCKMISRPTHIRADWSRFTGGLLLAVLLGAGCGPQAPPRLRPNRRWKSQNP